jgi:hypothetical protein
MVYDFGNLDEFRIIPCRDPVRLDVPRGDVMEAVGKARDTNPIFWNLWRVPDEFVPRLMYTLGL